VRKDLREFDAALPAEQVIIDHLWAGEVVQIGDGKVPLARDPDRQVRATFLRYLILYHDPLPEWGIRLAGAWIAGDLNLEGADLPRTIELKNCLIDTPVHLTGTHLQSLYLDGSCLRGINANWLRADGTVSLQGTFLRGTVKLTGARIGGDLDCSQARLIGSRLHAGGKRAQARALDGTGLKADTLHFSSARIRGQIRLTGAQLTGDLIFAPIDLRAHNGDAISMSRAKIEGGLYLPKGFEHSKKRPIKGRIRLTAAQVSFLSDGQSGWPGKGQLEINRFVYGAIVGGPVTATARIAWLRLQSDNQFYPQPWEQCARVLRDMGHAEDARIVLIDKEREQRRDTRRQLLSRKAYPATALAWLSDRLLAGFVAYGHRPLRALTWMLALWVIGIGVFDWAARQDALRPNTPIVLRSVEWSQCEPGAGVLWDAYTAGRAAQGLDPGSHRGCFHAQAEGRDYPRFNRYVYAADTLVPLVSLEMQEYWTPDDTDDRWAGKVAGWYLVFQIFAGWALSLLAVAGFTGIIRS